MVLGKRKRDDLSPILPIEIVATILRFLVHNRPDLYPVKDRCEEWIQSVGGIGSQLYWEKRGFVDISGFTKETKRRIATNFENFLSSYRAFINYTFLCKSIRQQLEPDILRILSLCQCDCLVELEYRIDLIVLEISLVEDWVEVIVGKNKLSRWIHDRTNPFYTLIRCRVKDIDFTIDDSISYLQLKN